MHPIQFGPALYTAVTVSEKIYILREYVVITNIIIVNLPFPWGKCEFEVLEYCLWQPQEKGSENVIALPSQKFQSIIEQFHSSI